MNTSITQYTEFLNNRSGKKRVVGSGVFGNCVIEGIAVFGKEIFHNLKK